MAASGFCHGEIGKNQRELQQVGGETSFTMQARDIGVKAVTVISPSWGPSLPTALLLLLLGFCGAQNLY